MEDQGVCLVSPVAAEAGILVRTCVAWRLAPKTLLCLFIQVGTSWTLFVACEGHWVCVGGLRYLNLVAKRARICCYPALEALIVALPALLLSKDREEALAAVLQTLSALEVIPNRAALARG